MKVYIMAVGERDPHWKQEGGKQIKYNEIVKSHGENYNLSSVKDGPIVSLFKRLTQEELENSLVYLLPTAKRTNTEGTHQGGEKTKDFLTNSVLREVSNCKVFVRPINVANPTDYRELYPEMRQVLEKIRTEVEDQEAEYFVNLQPGTPQIGHVFISLSMLGIISPKFIQLTRGGTVEEVDLSFMSEDEVLKRGINLFERGYFVSAAFVFQELRDVAVLLESKRKAGIFYNLCDVYEKWDTLQYNSALDAISNILKETDVSSYTMYENLREKLNAQQEILRSLLQKNTIQYVIDLYHNAKRRLEQENFPDVVWRLGTIHEVILKQSACMSIEKVFGVRPDSENFAQSIAPRRDLLRGILRNVFRVQNYRDTGEFYEKVPYSLNKEFAESILEQYDRAFINRIKTEYGVEDMWRRRNRLLHRLEMPSLQVIKEDIETMGKVIGVAWGTSPEPYCFDVDSVKEIAHIIGDVYRCL